MDVLQRIHGWLRPGGVLLDVHPEPAQPRVDIALADLRQVHLGLIDNNRLIGNIHAARAAIAAVVERGWYVRERAMVFDFVSHFASVDEWLRHRLERRSSSLVDPALIERARALLAGHSGGELQTHERVLATRLARRDTA